MLYQLIDESTSAEKWDCCSGPRTGKEQRLVDVEMVDPPIDVGRSVPVLAGPEVR